MMKYIETLAAWNQATAQFVFTTMFVTSMFFLMNDLSDELDFMADNTGLTAAQIYT